MHFIIHHLFIHLFNYSYIYLFIPSCTNIMHSPYSFIQSFICLFIHSPIHLSFTCSHLFIIHLFIRHLFIHTLTYSFTQLLFHSFTLAVGSDGADRASSINSSSIVSGSPLLSSVAFDPMSSDRILKGSGDSYSLGPDGVIMLTFGERLDKDISELSFDVDGRGSMKILLYDRQVQPMIVVREELRLV